MIDIENASSNGCSGNCIWSPEPDIWHADMWRWCLVACQRRDNEWQSANERNYGITVNSSGLVPVHWVHDSVHSEVTPWPAHWSVSAIPASDWSPVVCDRCRSNSWHLSWSPVRCWPSSLHQSYTEQTSMKTEIQIILQTNISDWWKYTIGDKERSTVIRECGEGRESE